MKCGPGVQYYKRDSIVKGTVPREFRFHVFFMNKVSPNLLSITLGPFRIIFRKFAEIFAAQGAPLKILLNIILKIG
jgi:hypothetical protein